MCCPFNGRTQYRSMASAFVGTETPNCERRPSCERTEKRHPVLCGRLPQFPCVRLEETVPDGRIVEIFPLSPLEQAGARRYKREPDVEVPIALPSTARHPTRWPPGGANSQTVISPARLADSKRPYLHCRFHFLSPYICAAHPLALRHIKIGFVYSLLAQHRFSDRFFLLVGPVFELFLQSCHGPVPNRAICVGPDEVAS